MRKQIVIFTFALILVVSIAGFYLAPSYREIALMKLEDGNFHEAFKYYKERSLQGDKSINIIAPVIKIYLHDGYPDKAIEVLESYMEDHPDSLEGHRQLASLYKASRYYTKYCASLEILQKLEPSVENLRELSDTYGFLGNYQAEMIALSKLLDSNLYHPIEEDYVRLASFYMLERKHDKEAINTLLDFFDKGTKDISISTAHMTVQLLAEHGEEGKAVSIAKYYLKGLKKDKREENAIVLSGVLHRSGKFDSSYEVVRPYLDNIDTSPELLQRLVEIELARKHDKEVYTDLSARFKKGKLPVLLEVALLDLAIQYNDDKLIEAVLKKATFARMEEGSLVRFADKISELNRPDLARLIRNGVGEDYLNEAPLLAAIIDIAEFDTKESIDALEKLPKNLVSAPEHKMMIVSIYLRHSLPELAFSLIDGMSISDIFRTIDSTQFAEMYLSMNKAGDGFKRINSWTTETDPQIKSLMDDTKFLMNVGLGNDSAVQKWLKNTKDIRPSLYTEAYYFASRYKHFPLALVFAQHIYKQEPTEKNQLELAETFMQNGRYDEALSLLQPLVERNSVARSVYLNGMADWIRHTAMNQHDNTRAKLDIFLSSVLNRKDLTLDEKRDLAYLLAESGFASKAEDIFIEVAGNQAFASHDVSELLAFWGETLSPKAVNWIKDRAVDTSGTEKALWLSYANDTGNPRIVIAVLNGSNYNLSTPVIDEYINALVLTSDYEKLQDLISNELKYESSKIRLLKLATIAVQENLTDISEEAWRKLYAADPGNDDAERELGMLAYSVNHYTEAQDFLEKYLKDNNGEYRENYAYAEILLRKGRLEEANKYFEKTRLLLSEIKQKDEDVLITEAALLYRTNNVEESFNLYHRLIKEYPTNKSLRADFIQALIENKQYAEATQLLTN